MKSWRAVSDRERGERYRRLAWLGVAMVLLAGAFGAIIGCGSAGEEASGVDAAAAGRRCSVVLSP